jgi:localization factor PodJL
MKPGMPWSVKGIDPETREAAKDAARRSGMTLGEWLNSMILEQGDEAEVANTQAPLPDAPPRMPPSAMKRDDMAVRLEDIATQLAQIARRDQEASPAKQTYVPPAPPPRSEDGDAIRKIMGRLDSNEQQTVEAFTAVNERLANLGRQLAETMKSGTAPRPQEPQALKSLEQAVRNIVDHIEVSEKRSRDSLKQVHDKIAEVAHVRQPSGDDAVHASLIADLEAKLGQLSNRVERAERRPSAEPDMLRKELSDLAERIESVRVTAEQLATRAQTAAVQTSQRELQEIERRIHSVLKEAQSAFAGQGTSQADFQKLRQEVSSLNQRIDASKAGAASERDVQALRIAFEQLQTRVAANADPKPFVDMDRRLNDLSRRVDQTQVAAKNIPEISQLERRVAEMDTRLKDAFKAQPDLRQQQAIERKLTEVMDRVGRAEQQLGHVETIERAVNQLFESVDHSRNWAREAAEDAANRMGQRLMAELPRQLQPANHSAELRMLEDGLRAVRESAVNADQRNQETLEAVHDTLEQIVEKLAELETAAVGHQIAQATLHAAEAQPAAAAPAWSTSSPAFTEPQEPAFEASFEPEPRFDPQEQAETSSAASWAASPQQQWQPQPDAAAEQPADDYIAAARRAALAAAHSNVLAGAIPASAPADIKTGKGIFSGLSFKRKRETSAWQATMEERRAPEIRPAAVAPQSNWRRTLFLAGVVLLLGAGAWTLSSVTGKPAKSLSQAEPADASQVASAQPGEGEKAVAEAPTPLDDLTTGALPGPSAGTTLQSLVAKPGSLANTPELPPPEIGTQALRTAAQTGDAAAQFIVATRFLDGTGIAGDLTQAAHWYEKSANAGLAPAQYRLATLFERGRGVPKDLATAMVWYTRAAEQGNVKSMHNAAVLSAGTELGAPNYETAHKWFLAASRYGLKDSQFNLAVLYERGLGTDKNPQEALFWYLIAASNKDQDAANRAKLLTKSLPKDRVAVVSKRVEAWVPEKASDGANVVSIQDPAWQDGRALWQQQPQTKTEDRLSTMSYMDRLVPQPPIYQPRAADPVLGSTEGLQQVGHAQTLLRQLGYQVGDATGIMDPQTSNAIRLFQFQTRQKVTGRASTELIDQLQAQFG